MKIERVFKFEVTEEERQTLMKAITKQHTNEWWFTVDRKNLCSNRIVRRNSK